MNMHNFSFGSSINRALTALTLPELQNIVPSAFATEKHVSRSAKYVYIPTSQIIEAMIREGFQPMRATQSRSRIEGKTAFTKHLIRFRHRTSMEKGNTVGDVFPEVVLINSHDGTSAYKLMSGLFRLVCSNGLIRAESIDGNLSVPHSGNIVGKVIEGSFEIVKNAQASLEATREWKGLELTAGERGAFAEAAHELRFAEADGTINTPILPSQLLETRRREDYANDLWTTFNKVQENVIKGGLQANVQDRRTRRFRRVTTRAVQGIDQDVRLNRALWKLTERMAELKGVAATAAAA